jgi:hypothetical protein
MSDMPATPWTLVATGALLLAAGGGACQSVSGLSDYRFRPEEAADAAADGLDAAEPETSVQDVLIQVPVDGGCTYSSMEVCDGIDNDCNGVIDDFWPEDLRTCGSCDNNCYARLYGVEPAGMVCEWNHEPGEPGLCKWSQCAADFYDRDGNPNNGCETLCIQVAGDDKLRRRVGG